MTFKAGFLVGFFCFLYLALRSILWREVMYSRKKWAVLSGISLLYFILCIVFGCLKYVTSDDAIMNLIAAGAFGSPSQYLIFNNIVIGYFLKFMYAVIPFVNWYLWLYLFFNLLSIIVICVVITDRLPMKASILVTVLINLLLAYDFYSNIQFTQSSTLYGVAGVALILAQLFYEKKSVILMVIATAIIAMGVGARVVGVGMVAPFVLAMLLFYKGDLKNKIKKVAIFFLMPIIVSVLMLAANFYAYYMNPEWRYFTDWNNIMSEKRDFGNFNFSWNKDEYLAAGFTEIDFKLMDMWLWNDTEYFTLDRLKTMKEIGKDTRVDGFKLDAGVLANSLEKMGESWKHGAYSAAFLIIIVFALIFFEKRYKFFVILQTFFVISEYYGLTCFRRIMWRVECGIWVSALFFTLMFLIYEGCFDKIYAKVTSDKVKKTLGICAIGLSAVITIIFGAGKVDTFVNQKHCRVIPEDDWMYGKAKAITEREGFYLTDVDTLYSDLCGAKNIFDIDAKYRDFYANVCQFGGWIMPSPIGLYHANLVGIANPARALVERDDVFFIGGGEKAGYIYVYLNEKYGPGINMEMVDEVYEAPVWRFSK